MGENRCVCCGAVIPEGLQVCPTCERKEQKQIKQMERFDSAIKNWIIPILILGLAVWWIIQLS